MTAGSLVCVRWSSSRASRAVAAAASLAIVLGVGSAAAQVDAAWTEFQGGPAKTGAVPDGPEPGYRQVWRTPIAPGGPGQRFGLSVPVIADDIAIAVGAEQVVGIDIVTGEQAFSVDRDLGPPVAPAVSSTVTGAFVVYTEGWGEGPPAAAGATGDGATPTSDTPAPELSPTTGASATATPGVADAASDSHLAAFNLATQEPLWAPVQLDAVSRSGVTLAGKLAVVGGIDGTVTAVALGDGTIAWKQELGATVLTSLAATDDLVLVSLQGDSDTPPVVVALDAASGEERWRHEPTDASAVVSAVSVQGSHAYAIFSGLSQTSVVAIDLVDGAQRWSRRVNAGFDVAAPPLVAAGRVFVTDLIGHTRALDAGTGGELWDFAMNVAVFRSVPTLVGSHLLVPAGDGELGAIDVETGELVWRRPADGSSLRSVAPAGDVLIAVRGGALTGVEAYEHDPDAALVPEASPTTLALGSMLGAMLAAALAVLVVFLLLGRVLAARMGPAFADDADTDAGEVDDEPIRDPWEDEDPEP